MLAKRAENLNAQEAHFQGQTSKQAMVHGYAFLNKEVRNSANDYFISQIRYIWKTQQQYTLHKSL